MEKYAIGLDYGTLSGRAVLVRVSDGALVSSASMDYPHAVMDEYLPCGKRLPVDWALQHPQDYLDVLYTVIPKAVDESGVDPKDIIALGVDFTCSTALPALSDGTPLCFLDKFSKEPQAYVKLWNSYTALEESELITQAAKAVKSQILPSILTAFLRIRHHTSPNKTHCHNALHPLSYPFWQKKVTNLIDFSYAV